MITIQENDFSVENEYNSLIKNGDSGAIAIFVGRVRDFPNSKSGFLLQHYAGMTEKVLAHIESAAHSRWQLLETRIIHRVGQLAVNDQIVFVGVSSAHRKQAFAACEFMIDILKTEAPFWKKEGDAWVDAKTEDSKIAERWMTK